MATAEMNGADREDELNLRALFRVFAAYKGVIGTIIAVCTLAAGIYALTAKPVYRSQVVVTEVSDQGLDDAGAGGQLSSLASLAGINLKAADSNRQMMRATLYSRKLVEQFIQRNNIMSELLPPGTKNPTMWRAVTNFKLSVLTIKEDERKGTITVSIDWKDPVTSARWANEFVALANEVLRGEAVENAERDITYLNKQIAGTTVVAMRQVMYSLIENETKTLMLANGRAEFAFTIVDPATPPEIWVSPQRALIILAGIFAGLLLGTAVAVIHHSVITAREGSKPGSA